MSEASNYVFGIRAVLEAIHAGKEIEKILLKKGLMGDLSKELTDLIKERGIPSQTVPIERINRITRKNHQGALAFISAIEYQSLENTLISVFEKGEVPLLVILDGITDVRNLGAIARSAACAGAHAIVVPEKGSAVVNADAIKTSAGALLEIPVCRVKNLWQAVMYLKNSGLSIVCATEKGAQDYYTCQLDGPMALVMGAEDTGITSQILRSASVNCKIPLQGKIESLNVSVAAGILLFEAVKQRKLSNN
ncbi:MAG: 23S rRNA (guanosine(2251)-2'-O)-methyltransferase RlmB [Breznakibacter sp.]